MPLVILTVTTFFPNSADRQRAIFVENLVRSMRRLCRVDVIAPVPFAPPVRWMHGWYTQSRIPREESIDGIKVLHPRFVVIPRLGWLSGLGYFLGILPVLRRARKQNRQLMIHVHCAYPDGVGVALAARALGLPYVVTAHGSDINVYAGRRGLRAQIRWALRGAVGVIAVSRDLERKIRNLLNGSKTRVTCIPCAGYDPKLFLLHHSQEIRQRAEAGVKGRLIIFVGKLVPIKGVDILIDAWAKLHHAKAVAETDQLVIIGDGKCRKTLEQQVSSAGIERHVRFLGTIPHPEVSRWLAASDALCLTSYNEGTPNVVVEALASGVPVVATRVGGVPEIVTEGVSGTLTEPGDPEAFASAIRDTLSRAWDREAIRRSVEYLQWGAIAERNCKFLQGVMSEITNGSLA
jgi:teichuronic acid biosynthesis glycosyltransferase TuaC